jgi:hypothetical protein
MATTSTDPGRIALAPSSARLARIRDSLSVQAATRPDNLRIFLKVKVQTADEDQEVARNRIAENADII